MKFNTKWNEWYWSLKTTTTCDIFWGWGGHCGKRLERGSFGGPFCRSRHIKTLSSWRLVLVPLHLSRESALESFTDLINLKGNMWDMCKGKSIFPIREDEPLFHFQVIHNMETALSTICSVTLAGLQTVLGSGSAMLLVANRLASTWPRFFILALPGK